MDCGTMEGNLRKMVAELASPVVYHLPLSAAEISLNPLLGRVVQISFTGRIHCIHCGREIHKSFNQGYCYPCFSSLARCDLCIVRPERCHIHAGTCREPEWAQDHCMQAHIVYLANSSGLKVGITRENQIPIRWIDQGAVQALPILRVSSRYHAGLVEVELKQDVSDRTQWQRMLRGESASVDLKACGCELLGRRKGRLAEIASKLGAPAWQILNQEPVSLRYPVLEYPVRVRSLNLDKTPEVTGTLLGIKGQYLILDCGVLNVRKFGGYRVCARWES